MFYQVQPDLDVYFRKTKTGDNSARTHLHGFYEVHCCTEGQLHLTIDGKPCILQQGEAALFFPYQSHSFARTGGNGYYFTFDPELVGTFHNEFANMRPKKNGFFFSYDLESVSEDSDVYTIKSFLYAVCSGAARMEYEEVPVDGRALLEKILILTEEHYPDCEFSLRKLATLLDYDYGYLSKYFLKMTGLKFGHYLNQRRIDRAVYILQKGDMDNIADVAFACGYGNVRSFNRNFKLIEEKTPQEFLRR